MSEQRQRRFYEFAMDYSKLSIYQYNSKIEDKLHSHVGEYQISIPLNTRMFIQHNQEIRDVNAQNRLILNPGDSHRHFTSSPSSNVLFINIEEDFLNSFFREKFNKQIDIIEFNPWACGSTSTFQKIVKQTLQMIPESLDSISIQEIELELASLILTLHSGSHREKVNEKISSFLYHPSLSRSIDFIHSKYNHSISLETLAKQVGISKYYLINLFKDNINMTPSKYINNVRLLHGKNLLITTRKDVTEISYEIGFGSLQTFERNFKKRYGTAPNVFRKSHS